MLALINEESRFPKGTDYTLLEKLHSRHAVSPHAGGSFTHPDFHKAIKMTYIPPPKLLNPSRGNAFTTHQLRRPQRVKTWLVNCLLRLRASVQHLYTPLSALTCEHNKAEMWSAILWVWSALCAGEKSVLRKPNRVFYDGKNKRVRPQNWLTSPWGVWSNVTFYKATIRVLEIICLSSGERCRITVIWLT